MVTFGNHILGWICRFSNQHTFHTSMTPLQLAYSPSCDNEQSSPHYLHDVCLHLLDPLETADVWLLAHLTNMQLFVVNLLKFHLTAYSVFKKPQLNLESYLYCMVIGNIWKSYFRLDLLLLFGLLTVAYAVTGLTTLSVSAISTNGNVKGGGVYCILECLGF